MLAIVLKKGVRRLTYALAITSFVYTCMPLEALLIIEDMLLSQVYKDNLVGLMVDKAHKCPSLCTL
jgi:hypothetical protein